MRSFTLHCKWCCLHVKKDSIGTPVQNSLKLRSNQMNNKQSRKMTCLGKNKQKKTFSISDMTSVTIQNLQKTLLYSDGEAGLVQPFWKVLW